MKNLKLGMFILLALMLVLTPLLGACAEKEEPAPSPAPAPAPAPAPPVEPIVLIFASFLPEANTMAQYNVWWTSEVERRTEGRVKFEFYWAGSLVKGPDLPKATGEGICDVALVATGYTRASFPLTGTYEVVYITEKPDAACRAFAELFNTYEPLRAEWKANNLKLLFFDMLGPNIFGFQEKVESLEDLRGLKIRTSGRITDVVKSLGATAVSMSSAEIYEAIDRGLLDGYTNTSLASAATRSFPEVAPYMLDPGMGNYSCIETVMNLDTWNKLPSDIKNVILEVSDEAIDKSAEILMADEDESMEKMVRDWGATLYVLSPDEAERWKAKVMPIFDTFISELEADGLPGKECFDTYKTLVEKYEKESVYISTYDRWVKK